MRETYTNQLHGLPTAYQELLWIKTDGMAAFKVSYNPKGTPLPGFKLRLHNVAGTHTSNQRIFGVYATSGYTEWGFFSLPHNHASVPDQLAFRYVNSGNSGQWITLNYNFSGDFIQETYLINGSGLSFDKSSISASTNSTRYDRAGYMGIGAVWNATNNALETVTNPCNSYINYLALYKGTTMSFEFIPCRRKSDGKIGMYDKVNSVFHASETGTEFTAGNPA